MNLVQLAINRRWRERRILPKTAGRAFAYVSVFRHTRGLAYTISSTGATMWCTWIESTAFIISYWLFGSGCYDSMCVKTIMCSRIDVGGREQKDENKR
jgi:hypothetical protein